MSLYHQIEVLRLLRQHKNISVNENSNGSFINLTEQSPELLKQLHSYITYVHAQEQQLRHGETEKKQIAQIFFSQDA